MPGSGSFVCVADPRPVLRSPEEEEEGEDGLSRIGGTSLDAGDARRRSPLPPMGGCGPQISPNAAAASALLTLQLQRALPPVESTAYARTDRAPQTLLGRPHDSALFPVVDYVTASTWTHDRGPRPCYELDGQSGPLTPL